MASEGVKILKGAMPLIDEDGIYPDDLHPSALLNPALTQDDLGRIIGDYRAMLDDPAVLRNMDASVVSILFGHLGLLLRGLD